MITSVSPWVPAAPAAAGGAIGGGGGGKGLHSFTFQLSLSHV